jgi:hypothetical protein
MLVLLVDLVLIVLIDLLLPNSFLVLLLTLQLLVQCVDHVSPDGLCPLLLLLLRLQSDLELVDGLDLIFGSGGHDVLVLFLEFLVLEVLLELVTLFLLSLFLGQADDVFVVLAVLHAFCLAGGVFA